MSPTEFHFDNLSAHPRRSRESFSVSESLLAIGRRRAKAASNRRSCGLATARRGDLDVRWKSFLSPPRRSARRWSCWFGKQSGAFRSKRDLREIGIGAARLAADIAAIDELITDQVNAILHHPTSFKARVFMAWPRLFWCGGQTSKATRMIKIRDLQSASWKPNWKRTLRRSVEFDQSSDRSRRFTRKNSVRPAVNRLGS